MQLLVSVLWADQGLGSHVLLWAQPPGQGLWVSECPGVQAVPMGSPGKPLVVWDALLPAHCPIRFDRWRGSGQNLPPLGADLAGSQGPNALYPTPGCSVLLGLAQADMNLPAVAPAPSHCGSPFQEWAQAGLQVPFLSQT